ncbi:MAG: DUF4388 domain-containing protein [Thermoanaerobaculia bacterium]
MGQHLSGRIETFDLVDLIQWLEVRRVSGRLILTKGADRKTIDWKDGDIVYVSGGRPADRLGFALLRSRAISISELYGALAENLACGEKLTRIVLENNLLTEQRLTSIVETLARRLLREVLGWRRGRFEFDPDFQAEDVLRIHLKLKGQVIAFEAVKQMDDSARIARAPDEEKDAETWQHAFRPEALEEAFWRVRGGLDPEGDIAKEKDRFFSFRKFGNALRARLEAPLSFLPIYEDSARYAEELLESHEGPEADENLLGLVELDPFLTLNLLQLSNSLAVGTIRRVATAREAHQRIGPTAFRHFVRRLAEPEFAKLSSTNPISRILRRAALAAAISGRHAASDAGVEPDEAYGAGLLHAIPYADLLDTVEATRMPSGDFRAAAIEYFRPIVGRIRSEAWRLPPSLAAVLSDECEPDAPALVRVVREARGSIPACAIGTVSSRGSAEPRPGVLPEVARIFSFLNLGEP